MNKGTHLVDGKYGFADLVDLNELSQLFETLADSTGFAIGLLDHPDMNVLIATRWRDICIKFHRHFEGARCKCDSSHRRLLGKSIQGQMSIQHCELGLIDCAYPIVINGIHVASLGTGQLLIDKPDLKRFRKQAESFGFDEEKYLKALGKVPVVDEEKLRRVTSLLGEVASNLARLGHARLAVRRDADRLERGEASLHKAQEALRMEITERSALEYETHKASQPVLRGTSHRQYGRHLFSFIPSAKAPNGFDAGPENVAFAKKRILIVDDNLLVREGLGNAINQQDDMIMCGEASDAPAARDSVAKSRPDAVIIDIALVDGGGMNLIRDLCVLHPKLPILVLTMHDEDQYAARAISAGARGYLMKRESVGTVMAALRKVLAGGIAVNEHVVTRLLSRRSQDNLHAVCSPIDSLSDRELEVYRCLGEGYSTRELAAKFKVTVSTVDTYRARIKVKLNLDNVSELVASAARFVATSVKS